MAIQRITRFLTAFSFFTFSFLFSHAQIGFGTTTPDASAVVHIQDTAKGLLIPRMTIAQKNAIPNPAEGLMIYQTDSSKGFWYFTGMQWVGFANNYKQTLILTGDVTDSEAAAKIAAEVGPATQEIRIYDCNVLTNVNLSMLTGITEITINNNPLLQSVNLNNLKTVDAGFNIYNCPSLSGFSVPLLETVGNNLRFTNTGIINLSFPVLKKATTAIAVESNPNLLSVSFPQLTGPTSRILPSFSIAENYQLVSIAAPQLSRAEVVNINGNKKCTSVNLSSLSTVRTLQLRGDSSLASVSFPSLMSVSSLLDIQADSSLSSISFPALTSGASILFADIKSTTVSLPALTTVSVTLSIQKNKSLASISLPVLTSVGATFNIRDNNVLTSLSVPLLASVGTITFLSNNSFTSLSIPALTSLASTGGELYITGCNSLNTILFPSLSAVKNQKLDFSYNKLTSPQVNALLNKFATIIPAINWTEFHFEHQLPAAPPTGQGIIDKITLSALNNNVITD